MYVGGNVYPSSIISAAVIVVFVLRAFIVHNFNYTFAVADVVVIKRM